MQVQAYLLIPLNKPASGLPDSHTKQLNFKQLIVSKQTLNYKRPIIKKAAPKGRLKKS